MNIHFVRAGTADAELVLQLMKEYYLHDHLHFRPEVARDAVSRLIEDESLGSLWLIQRGTDTIGYVVLVRSYCLEFGGRIGIVDELYLREGFRRRGIGTRALAFAEDLARALGAQALRLEVEQANDPARRLYERAGFVPHNRLLMTRPVGRFPGRHA